MAIYIASMTEKESPDIAAVIAVGLIAALLIVLDAPTWAVVMFVFLWRNPA